MKEEDCGVSSGGARGRGGESEKNEWSEQLSICCTATLENLLKDRLRQVKVEQSGPFHTHRYGHSIAQQHVSECRQLVLFEDAMQPVVQGNEIGLVLRLLHDEWRLKGERREGGAVQRSG